jgi:hypothetical protein
MVNFRNARGHQEHGFFGWDCGIIYLINLAGLLAKRIKGKRKQ